MNSVTLEAVCYRSIGFNDFSTRILPDAHIEQTAMQVMIDHLTADPTGLAHGCALCADEGRHTQVRNAYATFIALRNGADLNMQFSCTLLCDQHAHQSVIPSVPLADTGHLMTALEMIVLHEFVIEQLVMPDGIWDVEIELGGMYSDDLFAAIMENRVDDRIDNSRA